MSAEIDKKSVGLVRLEHCDIPLPVEGFSLERGGALQELRIAYECYGELSPQRDNVVLICHALTGDAHAAGRYGEDDRKAGWWENMIGPGKGIDTNRFHVICTNILGGCMGTTGPASINPETGKPFGLSFPEITIKEYKKGCTTDNQKKNKKNNKEFLFHLDRFMLIKLKALVKFKR